MNRLNKTESAVFLYCRFSLFLKDLFFPVYVLTAGILSDNMIKFGEGSSIGPTLAFLTSLPVQDGGPHDTKMAAPTKSDPRWRPP